MLKFSIGAENPNAERTLVDITDEEKELFKYGEVRCFIRFLDDNTEMNESNYLKKVSFENLRYVPDEGFIGGAVAKRVTLELYNENNTFNIENKEFELFLGIVKDDGTTKYISYGNYIIQKPENDNVKDNTSFEALDYMIKFNKTYEDKLKRNCTLLELFLSICEQAGVSTDVTSFRNSSFVVSSGMFVEGESLRDVLIAISQVAFTWARVGVDNKMYMDFEIKTTPTETLNNEEYYELSFNDDYTPLNKIVFATRDVEGEEVVVQDIDSINTYGENSLVIYDNPIAYTEEDRVTLIEAGKQLFGLTYKPLSMKTVGYVFLDETDFIAVTDMQGQTYKTYVFDHSFEYIGTISDTIENQAMTDNEVEYEFQGTLSTQFKKTQVIVDKTNQKVTILAQKNEEFSNQLAQIELNLNNIEFKVENIQEFTREKTQIDNLYIEDVAEGEGYILDFIVYGDTNLFNTNKIKICVSLKSKGYGTDVELLTESGEEILTEDNQKIVITRTSYHLITLELELDDVLRSLTIGDKTYYDELHILQDGTITVKRKIGVNEEGELYLLQKETITTLNEKLVLPTNKEQYYYFIDNIDDLKYYAKYITQNDYSDSFLTKMELGTKIEQNAEAVKIAWNQISDFIQMMILNNKVSFTILDENNNILMSLDKEGQNFYKSGENIPFGELGIKKVEDNNYISFSLSGNYGETISDGMCWGITNKETGKFFPIMYIKDFSVGDENSEIGSGKLILEGCELVLDALASGITIGELNIHGDVLPGLFFTDANSGTNLLTILNEIDNVRYESISMLDNNISFYKNQAGSYSFKVGQSSGSNGVLLTDDGSIQADSVYSNQLSVENWISCYGTITCDDLIETSVENKKENIRKYDNDALKEILATDIYYYNLKKDKTNLKIGAVIGNDYNCSNEIIRKDGIDIYSMTALAYKAIQQQQEEIDNLKSRLKNIEKLLAKGE